MTPGSTGNVNNTRRLFICSYKFKAKPVNPKVMSNLNIGLKMPTHKEPTKAIGFNLEGERLMKERATKRAQEEEQKEEEHYEFHARPVSTKMLEGPVVSSSNPGF